MEIVWTVVFCTGLLVGVLATLFQLPGTFVIASAALVAGLCTGFSVAPWWFIAILFAVAVAAELGDNALSAWALRRYEGTTRGMWAAVLGGFVGAVLGGSLTSCLGALGLSLGPVVAVLLFMIGPILGGCGGAYVGALLAELSAQRPPGEARRAALGALLGRAAGTVMKTVLSVSMAGGAAWYVVPRLLGHVVR